MHNPEFILVMRWIKFSVSSGYEQIPYSLPKDQKPLIKKEVKLIIHYKITSMRYVETELKWLNG